MKLKNFGKNHTNAMLKIGKLGLLVLAAGLVTLSGCNSVGEPRFDAQEALAEEVGEKNPSEHQTSVLMNHKQTTLYQHMLTQGNYSDAAILESFQHIQPGQSHPSSLFTNISTPTTSPSSAKNIRSQFGIQRPHPQLSANWHADVGWKLVLDGNYRGAEAAYRQSLRKNGNSAKAYLGLGMALSLQGDRHKAISAYEKAITIQPNFAAALVHLGYAYTKENTQGQNIAKARKLFKQASELGDPFAMLALLDLQAQKGSA
ncbi:MAG: tetratricopeptide repeat protein [Nitrospirae bacterium]|nr:tetratricopeptide repeat protein [Nitrospirota bacterium]MDA1304145.1 tetratricopeptide repeat protein [Nitrospirota bacterium]